jgi:glycosyltransferase involved in cell wall biosynthesis
MLEVVTYSKKWMPSVSIIVPTYNRRDRCHLVILSLLKQDFIGTFEVIVVDDGSTDGTVDYLQTINDSRLKIVKQTNQGAASARKNGVDNAKADIVVFNDSDDIAYPNKIQVLYSALLGNPDCVLSLAILENKSKKDWQIPLWARELKGDSMILNRPLDHFFNRYYPIASAMNLAVRTKIAKEAAADCTYFKAANDYHFQFKLAAKGPFVCVAKITGEYHIGEGISSKYGSYSQDAYSIVSMIKNYLALEKPKEYSISVKQRVENETAKVLIPLLLNKRYSLFFTIVKIMLVYGRWVKLPRRIWWAVSSHLEKKR